MSGRMEKLVFFLNQLYDVPYGRFGEMFVSNLAEDLNVILGQKWKADRVIIFQTVILQRVRLVTGTKNIPV